MSRFDKLDQALRRPVFKKEFFPDPVIIDTLEFVNGKMKAPTGPGMGVVFDPGFMAKLQSVK